MDTMGAPLGEQLYGAYWSCGGFMLATYTMDSLSKGQSFSLEASGVPLDFLVGVVVLMR